MRPDDPIAVWREQKMPFPVPVVPTATDCVTPARAGSENQNNAITGRANPLTIMIPPSDLSAHPLRVAAIRRPMTILLSAAVLSVTAVFAWAQWPNTPTQGRARKRLPVSERQQDPVDHTNHLREGTEITGRPGYFRMTGERVTFFTADGAWRFVCLENLNLQRVAQAIAEDPTRLEWSVTGTITEYRGTNFLAVDCAVLTAGNLPSPGGSSR